ncbi:MAG: NTP transferase domain-containing protein [Desulfarculaceae bacterium]|nr:NTP transferase domain-containing protein [Desulfarculaceae bacterium]MCF8048645.1 NTP transferase domain-containing protein [Desulfarculaceae bacterium]MCF8066680.1 NTP transferase domain-containing protein [Desulfarculaceae bacterium]MCF8098614.1 NTP transferase domain-containing protein [Desulfarculaceae bacterium]MCF8121336.1 NTP transferase domain-containing protein [Desulfarculaceae bacterium]
MQAAVIAGGLGTRLGALTKDIPKPLVPVAGRPFLDHQLKLLQAGGVDKVVLCIGHMGEQIQAFVGDGSRWGLEVAYSLDGPTLLGTGGSLKKAAPLLEDRFLLTWGDSYLEIEHRKVWAAFLASGLPAMMVVWRNQGAKEPSNVRLEGERVGDYDKWSPGPEFDCIDYGLSALSKQVLQAIPEGEPFAIEEVFRDLAQAGKLGAYVVERAFMEIGSPAGLAELEAHIRAQEGRQP